MKAKIPQTIKTAWPCVREKREKSGLNIGCDFNCCALRSFCPACTKSRGYGKCRVWI